MSVNNAHVYVYLTDFYDEVDEIDLQNFHNILEFAVMNEFTKMSGSTTAPV
jgi:hypothetical protein